MSAYSSKLVKICAVIPTYNEEKTVGDVVRGVKKFVDTVFVVNNGSTDNSVEVAEQNGAKVIHCTAKRGYGAAQYAGHLVAMENGFDYILQLDADGEHDIKYIPVLLEALQDDDYDIVVGSRFLNGNHKGLPFVRRIGIIFFSKVVGFLDHTKVTDVTSGFKVYKVSSLKKLSKPSDIHPAVEQILEMARKGMKLREVPIEMTVRQAGESHLNPVRFALYPFRMMWAISKVMLFR